MRRRRYDFAAPVILVIGCSAPPPERLPRMARRTEPISNPPEVVIDAGVPDAAAPPPDAPAWRAQVDPCSLPPHESGVICNPPSAIFTEVIEVAADGDGGVRILVASGTDDGVSDGWTGTLVDDDRLKVRGSQFVLQSCAKRTCRARVKLTPDEVRANPRARLDAP